MMEQWFEISNLIIQSCLVLIAIFLPIALIVVTWEAVVTIRKMRGKP